MGGRRRPARRGDDAEQSARDTKAFLRTRAIATAVDLLRLILAYCLGERGLRSTAAWATAMELADISNVALLQRLRRCGDWLALLVGEALTAAAPQASRGRLIRIVDATTVPKAGRAAKRGNKLWRIHSAFDLPRERFGHFELTDQHGGETLDRIPVVKGESRIGDRCYLQPDRMANALDQDADVLIRAGWRNARWLDAEGQPVDFLAEFRKASERGLIDRPILIARKHGEPLALRLIAVKKSGQAAEAARRIARRQARKDGYQISKLTLAAAEWVIIVTPLAPEAFSTADVLALYRLRWRIDIDQAWRLSRFCGRGGVSVFDPWRGSSPIRRGRSDRFQGRDRFGIGQDQLGAFGSAASVAA